VLRLGRTRLGGRALRLEQAKGPSAAASTYLESLRLGSCNLGKSKYLWKRNKFLKIKEEKMLFFPDSVEKTKGNS